MWKVVALAGVLTGLAMTPAQAEVLTLRCDQRPGGILNVYRNDLTIDLTNKTDRVRVYSTYKKLDGTIENWANHKADPDVILDMDTFVVVDAGQVRWGTDVRLQKVFFINEKLMTDGRDVYQCTDQM